jgi:hypothetical protein
VERLNANVGPIEAALQQRPEIFQPVGVDFAANVLHGVVNYFMLKFIESTVGLQRIREQRGPGENILANFGLLGLFLGIVNNLGPNLAATLKDSHHGSLIFSARASDATRPNLFMHVARLGADERLIGFNLARELVIERTRMHRVTNSVIHKPSRFLSDAQVTRDLATANTILAIGN